MSLFTGKYDRHKSILTHIYQIDTENTEEVETFLTPEGTHLPTVRDIAHDVVKTGDPFLKELAQSWHEEVDAFTSLCLFAKILMESLYYAGPTVRQFQELAEWSDRVPSQWAGIQRTGEPGQGRSITDLDTPLFPAEVRMTYKDSRQPFRAISGFAGGIVKELNDLVFEYREGTIHEKLGECQECSSLFSIEARRDYCSHRCKARADMRRKRSKQA